MYCIDPDCDEPIMLINSHIGYDEAEGMGIDGALFQKELLWLDSLGKKRIQIWINCVGGIVMDGYNIASAILKSKTPVDTYNVGVAASIAGVIFMCGRNRIMMDYALLMMHKPNGTSVTSVIENMQDSLVTMLAAKSKLSKEAVDDLMNVTTWLTAEDCKDKGFATEVEYTEESNKKRMRAVTEVTDMHKEALKITNSLLPAPAPDPNNNILKPDNKMLKKVTNKLGLTEDANENSILEAIEAMQNKATSEKEAMQKQIKDAEDALNELKNKYEALETEAATEKAKNMVEGFATIGKIKNEAVEAWTAKAVVDFDGVKALIEDLPINAVANKIGTEEQDAPTAEDIMHQAMKEIRNKTVIK